MADYIKKNGLLYSSDSYTVLGVDDTSTLFTGRIPFGAHAIDSEVFSDCPYESISIPDSVKKLGANLFSNSMALEKVKLPSTITELPPYLFSGCVALSKVTMPMQLTKFPEGLFMGCSSLLEIPFRTGITELPENVIANCTGIKSLVIPNTVKKIGSKAVAGCTSLESVVFPECIEEIAPDAFEGCTSLHNVRIEGESGLFYISEDDGCLYFAGDESDKKVVQIYGVTNNGVGFFKDNVDDEPIDPTEDEDMEDDDTFYSAEIGASDEEMGIVEQENNQINNTQGVKKMDDENVDSMLADIMGAEAERNNVSEDIGISDAESAALSGAIEVMSDNTRVKDAYVSNDELANLFEKSESQERAERKAETNTDEIDSKTKILISSVKFSKVLEFNPTEESPEDPELYVIAEKLVKDTSGNDCFTQKLEACCTKFAHIHDYKRVIMLYGLPFENDEFYNFYHHFMSKKNIILACDAENPSSLSDFGKKVCELSRISLDKVDLAEQRRNASIKSNTLIKLVIRDKYE